MKRARSLRTYHRVEILVLRRKFAFEHFCEECGVPTKFVSLEDAMDVSELTMRELARLVEAKNVHFVESRGGYLAICESSLPKRTHARSIENV